MAYESPNEQVISLTGELGDQLGEITKLTSDMDKAQQEANKFLSDSSKKSGTDPMGLPKATMDSVKAMNYFAVTVDQLERSMRNGKMGSNIDDIATKLQTFGQMVERSGKNMYSSVAASADQLGAWNKGDPGKRGRLAEGMAGSYPGLDRSLRASGRLESMGSAIGQLMATYNTDRGSNGDGALSSLRDSLSSLSMEMRAQTQMAQRTLGVEGQGGGQGGGRGGRRGGTPDAHRWTRQLVNTTDNIISSAMYPAIEQFIMKPMQTGMAASQTMPGFLPNASLVQKPFMQIAGYLNKMGGDVQSIEMERKSLQAVTGSPQAAQSMIEHAVQIARTEPVEFGTALSAFRSFAVFPGTRDEVKNDAGFRSDLLDTIQRMAILNPEQGEKGAMFALREVLSGQVISLKRRFNVDMPTIFEAAGKTGMSTGQFHALAGSDKLQLIGDAMKKITGVSALVEKSLTTQVQSNDIGDTMMQAFALPWNQAGAGVSMMSLSQEDKYRETLVLRNRRMFGTSMSEEEIQTRAKREASIAAATPVGAMASGLRGINDLLGQVFQDTNLGGVVTGSMSRNIMNPILEAAAEGDNGGRPLKRLMKVIDQVSQGIEKTAKELGSNEDLQGLIGGMINSAITTTATIVAPAAAKGMAQGTAAIVNNAITPDTLMSMFSGSLGTTTGGKGLMSPMTGVMGIAGFYGASMAGSAMSKSSLFTGMKDIASYDFNKKTGAITAFDAKGGIVPQTRRSKALTSAFGTDFNKGWHLPGMAMSGMLAMSGMQGLTQGGGVKHTMLAAAELGMGVTGLYSLIPQSVKAQAMDRRAERAKALKEKRNLAAEQAREKAREKRRNTTSAYAPGVVDEAYSTSVGRSSSGLQMEGRDRGAESRARRAGVGRDIGLSKSPYDRSGRNTPKAPIRYYGKGASALMHPLKPWGYQAQVGVKRAALARTARQLGNLAGGPMSMGISAIGMAGGIYAGVSQYNADKEMNDKELKNLNSQMEDVTGLSEYRKMEFRNTLGDKKRASRLSAIGTGMMTVGMGFGMATAGTGIGAILGAGVAGTGLILKMAASGMQGKADTQAEKDVQTVSMLNAFNRSKMNMETVTSIDVDKEGTTAQLAQSMGSAITDKNRRKWRPLLDREYQRRVLEKGGGYSTLDYLKGHKGQDHLDAQYNGWGKYGNDIIENARDYGIKNKETGKMETDISAKMIAGLELYQTSGRSLMQNKKFREIMSKPESTETMAEITKMVDIMGKDGNTSTGKFRKQSEVVQELLKKTGVDVTASDVDKLAVSLHNASKGALEASKGTLKWKDVVKDVSETMAKSAGDMYQMKKNQMSDLMPKFAKMSGSHFINGDRYGKYFGLRKDTQKIVKKDMELDASLYEADPAGYLTRMQTVGKKFKEFDEERKGKILKTGSIMQSFKDSGGRFRSQWEIDGEYAFQKSTLNAAAQLGRPGAKEQQTMNKDLNKYLEGIKDPDKLWDQIKEYSGAGFLIDPKLKMKAFKGMIGQGLTNNMKTPEAMMDEAIKNSQISYARHTGDTSEGKDTGVDRVTKNMSDEDAATIRLGVEQRRMASLAKNDFSKKDQIKFDALGAEWSKIASGPVTPEGDARLKEIMAEKDKMTRERLTPEFYELKKKLRGTEHVTNNEMKDILEASGVSEAGVASTLDYGNTRKDLKRTKSPIDILYFKDLDTWVGQNSKTGKKYDTRLSGYNAPEIEEKIMMQGITQGAPNEWNQDLLSKAKMSRAREIVGRIPGLAEEDKEGMIKKLMTYEGYKEFVSGGGGDKFDKKGRYAVGALGHFVGAQVMSDEFKKLGVTKLQSRMEGNLGHYGRNIGELMGFNADGKEVDLRPMLEKMSKMGLLERVTDDGQISRPFGNKIMGRDGRYVDHNRPFENKAAAEFKMVTGGPAELWDEGKVERLRATGKVSEAKIDAMRKDGFSALQESAVDQLVAQGVDPTMANAAVNQAIQSKRERINSSKDDKGDPIGFRVGGMDIKYAEGATALEKRELELQMGKKKGSEIYADPVREKGISNIVAPNFDRDQLMEYYAKNKGQQSIISGLSDDQLKEQMMATINSPDSSDMARETARGALFGTLDSTWAKQAMELNPGFAQLDSSTLSRMKAGDTESSSGLHLNEDGSWTNLSKAAMDNMDKAAGRTNQEPGEGKEEGKEDLASATDQVTTNMANLDDQIAELTDKVNATTGALDALVNAIT